MLKLQVDASLLFTPFDDPGSAFVTKMRTAPQPARPAQPARPQASNKILWRVGEDCARAFGI